MNVYYCAVYYRVGWVYTIVVTIVVDTIVDYTPSLNVTILLLVGGNNTTHPPRYVREIDLLTSNSYTPSKS